MLRIALVSIVTLAPLAFGAAPTWAWSSLAAALGILLCAWGAAVAAARARPVELPGGAKAALLCVGCIILYAGVQSLPLSAWTGASHPLWAEAARVPPHGEAGSISLNPEETRVALARLLSIAGTALLAVQLGGDRAAREGALGAIAVAATGYAAYGLIVLAAGSESVLWAAKPAYRDAATGTFINANAFAAYAGLGLLAVSAVLTARIARDGAAILIGPAWPWTGSWLVLAASIVASQSRAGLISTALALSVFLSTGRRGRRGVAAALGLSFLLVPCLVAALDVAGQWHGLQDQLELRAAVYTATLEAIARRPWLGHGLGTFAETFRLVRPETVEQTFLQAHNGYLQAALELGVPAATGLVLAFALLAAACWRNARQGALAGRAGAAAAALLGVHALVDFAPQVPAVAVTAAFLMGLGAVHPKWRDGERPPGRPPAPIES